MKHLWIFAFLLSTPFLIGISAPFVWVEPGGGKFPAADFPEMLTGAFTGGFGEETCRSCHFDNEGLKNPGSLEIAGLPEHFLAGKEYALQIILKDPNMLKAGFQLSFRFEDGTQSGKLIQAGENTVFTTSVKSDVQYLQHSAKGTTVKLNGEHSWSFSWIAPQNPDRTVTISLAANAASGDGSPFEDWIYTLQLKREIK